MIQLSKRTVILALVAFTVVAGLATASFVRTFTGAADAANFKDTPPWAAEQINWLADNGIARGYTSDNTFRPDLNITRAQAAFWFGNYNNTIELVKTESNPGSFSSFSQTASCPAGKRAVAGGGQISTPETFMTDSYPDTPSIWWVRWETDNNAPVNPSYVRAWALCVPNAIS